MQGAVLLSRLEPVGGPQHYKSYSIRAPLSTHWRPATCEEYECQGFLKGFITTVDLTSDLGQRQYHYLTHDRSRSYRLERVSLEIARFHYGPGNKCFDYGDHRVRTGKPPRLLVVGGDWRGNPRREVRIHSSIDDWVDDSREHQDRIATLIKRG